MSDAAWRDLWSGDDVDHSIGAAHRERLAAHWREFFQDFLAGALTGVIAADIASGAGAALVAGAQAAAGGAVRFLAVDISERAARAAARKVAGARGVVADAARLPLADRSLDIAVSQFGVEYAGVSAFAEAARCLKSGGAFRAICHFSGGGIDAECAANADLLDRIAATHVVNAAENAMKETFARRVTRAAQLTDKRLEDRLSRARTASARAVEAAPHSAARVMFQRFLADLDQLSARRLAYEERDALGWISGMRASLSAYRERMASMRRAALDPKAIDEVARAFSGAGLCDFDARPLVLVGGAAPAAWVISARHPR